MVISIEKVHDILAHASDEATRKTSQVLGWILMQGTLPSCKSYLIAKAKQKNICKTRAREKAEKPGECIFSSS